MAQRLRENTLIERQGGAGQAEYEQRTYSEATPIVGVSVVARLDATAG